MILHSSYQSYRFKNEKSHFFESDKMVRRRLSGEIALYDGIHFKFNCLVQTHITFACIRNHSITGCQALDALVYASKVVQFLAYGKGIKVLDIGRRRRQILPGSRLL